MKTMIVRMIGAAVLALGLAAGGAQAAISLGQFEEIDGGPKITGSGELTVFPSVFSFNAVGPLTPVGFVPSGPITQFQINGGTAEFFALSFQFVPPQSAQSVPPLPAPPQVQAVLSGDVADVSPGTNVFRALLDVTGGTAQNVFGSYAIFTFTPDGIIDANTEEGTFTVGAASVIPLPAPLLLLFTALGAAAVAYRRRAVAQA